MKLDYGGKFVAVFLCLTVGYCNCTVGLNNIYFFFFMKIQICNHNR